MSAQNPLYSYSANTSTSTVSQAQRSIRDSRHSPHVSHLGTANSGGTNIIDRPLNRSRGAEVSLGAWAFMFAEIVAYSQSRVDSVADLEKRCVVERGCWRQSEDGLEMDY